MNQYFLLETTFYSLTSEHFRLKIRWNISICKVDQSLTMFNNVFRASVRNFNSFRRWSCLMFLRLKSNNLTSQRLFSISFLFNWHCRKLRKMSSSQKFRSLTYFSQRSLRVTWLRFALLELNDVIFYLQDINHRCTNRRFITYRQQ